MKSVDLKIFFPILIFIALVGIYFVLKNSALADLFIDMELLITRVKELGFVGPLLVIGLMILAIIFNPLPSAPIAIAAGALYGHTLGTIYIVIGAENWCNCSISYRQDSRIRTIQKVPGWKIIS